MTSTMQLHNRVTPAATDDTGRRAICFAHAFLFSPFPALRRMHLGAARCVVLAFRVANRGTGAGTGIQLGGAAV